MTVVNVETGELVKLDGPLNEAERALLRHHERIVENLGREVGKSLATIRDQRLYREGYQTFELYCFEMWGIGRSYANKQIAAVEVSEILGTNVPIREAHARELSGLRDDPDMLRLVWTEANELSDGSLTAEILREVRKRLVAEDPTPGPHSKPEPKPQRRPPLPDQAWRAGYSLRKKAESIERIFADDRLAQNKEQISALMRSDLLYVQRVVAAALEVLPMTEG